VPAVDAVLFAHPKKSAVDITQAGVCQTSGPVHPAGPVSVHVAMIEHSATALMQSPAGRKAHRIHSDRVTSARTAS
jgi:hypothetical protein